MSFFMISMPVDGFRSSPPVSKQTPLPTSVTLGWAGSPQAEIDQPRRARRGHADRMNQRKILSRQVVADDAVETGAEALGEFLRPPRQFLRSHVVRRRVDEIAGKRGGLGHARDIGDVDAVRRHQPDVGRIRLAVAAEAIAAERKGERRKPRVVRRIGEAIDARRQQARQQARVGTGRGIWRPRPRGRTPPARSLRPPRAASGMPRAWRQSRWPARTAGPRAGRPAQIASHVALVANVMGMADAADAVSNTECMLVSVFH